MTLLERPAPLLGRLRYYMFYKMMVLDEKNGRRKESIRAQVKGYMKRAEELKNLLKPAVEDSPPENDTELSPPENDTKLSLPENDTEVAHEDGGPEPKSLCAGNDPSNV